MRWPPWSRKPPEPVTEPAVTDEQRADLEQAKVFLAEQTADLDAKVPEIRRVTNYLRKEQERNHLAERFRIAFGGEVNGRRY